MLVDGLFAVSDFDGFTVVQIGIVCSFFSLLLASAAINMKIMVAAKPKMKAYGKK